MGTQRLQWSLMPLGKTGPKWPTLRTARAQCTMHPLGNSTWCTLDKAVVDTLPLQCAHPDRLAIQKNGGGYTVPHTSLQPGGGPPHHAMTYSLCSSLPGPKIGTPNSMAQPKHLVPSWTSVVSSRRLSGQWRRSGQNSIACDKTLWFRTQTPNIVGMKKKCGWLAELHLTRGGGGWVGWGGGGVPQGTCLSGGGGVQGGYLAGTYPIHREQKNDWRMNNSAHGNVMLSAVNKGNSSLNVNSRFPHLTNTQQLQQSGTFTISCQMAVIFLVNQN